MCISMAAGLAVFIVLANIYSNELSTLREVLRLAEHLVRLVMRGTLASDSDTDTFHLPQRHPQATHCVQTGSADVVHNLRFYSSIPAYPMNVAPTQMQWESPTCGKKDQTARKLANELRRSEKERKSEKRRRTTRDKIEVPVEDSRDD
ncbi:hypothetical protein BLNAU_9748 [Blattamonas nauphoetae]|uniref:Uncharacterized protein n=1 Tax=Blattamonas nauphoetae TaxID=2049346 RepID=A0ABQ9XV77_9EUKA|nr:hypothetical protein BLNAU_9748 [Blattamonas nauphoetae]